MKRKLVKRSLGQTHFLSPSFYSASGVGCSSKSAFSDALAKIAQATVPHDAGNFTVTVTCRKHSAFQAYLPSLYPTKGLLPNPIRGSLPLTLAKNPRDWIEIRHVKCKSEPRRQHQLSVLMAMRKPQPASGLCSDHRKVKQSKFHEAFWISFVAVGTNHSPLREWPRGLRPQSNSLAPSLSPEKHF